MENHFYKLFEHSCVAAVCENNQLIIIFYKTNKSWTVSPTSCLDSPSVHVTEGKKSRPFVTLSAPISINSPEWEDAVRQLQELYTMSAPKRLCVVFWDALINIGVAQISPHLSRRTL